MRRQTSFTSPVDLAVDREIDSKYDVVRSVAEQIGAIEDINTAITDGTLANMLNIINMTVATGAPGSNVTWDGTTLTVPKGDTGADGQDGQDGLEGAVGPQGVQGIQGIRGLQGLQGLRGLQGIRGASGYNGLTPVVEFDVDGAGNLVYDVASYADINGSSVNVTVADATEKEW